MTRQCPMNGPQLHRPSSSLRDNLFAADATLRPRDVGVRPFMLRGKEGRGLTPDHDVLSLEQSISPQREYESGLSATFKGPRSSAALYGRRE